MKPRSWRTHADGLWPLEANHGDDVAIEFAGLEGVLQALLGMEDAGLGLDDAVLGLHRRNLDDRGAEITAQQLEAAILRERGRDRGQNLGVARLLGRSLEGQLFFHQLGFDGVAGEATAPDGLDVFV